MTETQARTTTEEPDQTRAAWAKFAAGYDEFVTPTHFGLGAEALRRAGLRPGMRLLDVAAGSGAVSLSAARLGVNVLAVDISPTMVERLKARAGQEDQRGHDAHHILEEARPHRLRSAHRQAERQGGARDVRDRQPLEAPCPRHQRRLLRRELEVGRRLHGRDR